MDCLNAGTKLGNACSLLNLDVYAQQLKLTANLIGLYFYIQMCLGLLRGGRLAQKRRGVDHKMCFNLPERENQLMYCIL